MQILNAKEKEEDRLRQEFDAREAMMYEKSKKQKFIPRNNYQQKVSIENSVGLRYGGLKYENSNDDKIV